jgi:predicted dehydrogenase
MGCIGMGGRGRSDMGAFLRFSELQVLAVCDVNEDHRNQAKARVDNHYGNNDCATYNDFREIVNRDDVDTVMIATPDHWHAVIAVEAMKHGKDVFCEKPETLTIREGRIMVDTARRFGRVFSGGSQRVWGDYNWFHRMIRGGAIGQPREAWVNVGGPSRHCYLPGEPVPEGLDWNLWLGPAPWVPFNRGRLNFRPWRDYSGGGMTDWGCHGFGGALFALGLHETGPTYIYPPGSRHEQLTYYFEGGIAIHHGGGWGGILSFRGSEREIPPREEGAKRPAPPNVDIPNYKGHGGFFGDFVHCVRTRERPFRDIEIAHRTATVAHLGNLAYWLKRELHWDPVKEDFVNDPDASRWLDREKRGPWGLA